MWLYSCKYYCRKETGLKDVGDAFTNNPATRTAHSKQQHRREKVAVRCQGTHTADILSWDREK